MKYFKLYYGMSEDIYEKYEALNYRTLEEMFCLRPDEEFTAELFWVNVNSNGQERCSRYEFKSEALDLLMHDALRADSYFRRILYPQVKNHYAEEAYFRTAREETENGIFDRECWIICCENLINSIAEYSLKHPEDSYELEAHRSKGFSFIFSIPKKAVEEVFTGSDLDFFTDPRLAHPSQFHLVELGARNIVVYALVPFYWQLAKYCKDPGSPENRDLDTYYVGLH